MPEPCAQLPQAPIWNEPFQHLDWLCTSPNVEKAQLLNRLGVAKAAKLVCGDLVLNVNIASDCDK